MRFFVSCIPEEELEFWFFRYRYGEMFFLLSEWLGRCYRHIFDHPERSRIADTVGTKPVYLIESIDSDLRNWEDTFDIQDFLWEIARIMYLCYRSIHRFSELRYSLGFDRESCRLTMSTISDKKMFAFIEELYQIAPFWCSTGADRELFWNNHPVLLTPLKRGIRDIRIHRDSISLSTRERVIVSIFHHDAREIVELSQTTCYEPDDPMIQICCIKK